MEAEDISGQRVRIDYLGSYRPDIGRYGPEHYYATALCVDFMGTLTFEREGDGFLGVAGLGAWVVVR